MKAKTDLPLIARRLRALLWRKHLTQADICRISGMSAANLSEVLRGVRLDPKLSTVERIVEAAGATMAELYQD